MRLWHNTSNELTEPESMTAIEDEVRQAFADTETKIEHPRHTCTVGHYLANKTLIFRFDNAVTEAIKPGRSLKATYVSEKTWSITMVDRGSQLRKDGISSWTATFGISHAASMPFFSATEGLWEPIEDGITITVPGHLNPPYPRQKSPGRKMGRKVQAPPSTASFEPPAPMEREYQLIEPIPRQPVASPSNVVTREMMKRILSQIKFIEEHSDYCLEFSDLLSKWVFTLTIE
jgi:hypothetical protein